MNFTLFITVLLTAVTLVVAAYVIAKLIGPRSQIVIYSLSHLECCYCNCSHDNPYEPKANGDFRFGNSLHRLL